MQCDATVAQVFMHPSVSIDPTIHSVSTRMHSSQHMASTGDPDGGRAAARPAVNHPSPRITSFVAARCLAAGRAAAELLRFSGAASIGIYYENQRNAFNFILNVLIFKNNKYIYRYYLFCTDGEG